MTKFKTLPLVALLGLGLAACGATDDEDSAVEQRADALEERGDRAEERLDERSDALEERGDAIERRTDDIEGEVDGMDLDGDMDNGAMTWGYPSIVGSGPNAMILHYSASNRQMKAGDLLLALSVSGNDANLLAATEAAHERDMTVVVLSGRNGGQLAAALRETDVLISVPHDRAARVREVHALVRAVTRQSSVRTSSPG